MRTYQIGALQEKVQKIGLGLTRLQQQISLLTQQLAPHDISSYGRSVVSESVSEHSTLLQSIVLKQESIQQLDLYKKPSDLTTLDTSQNRKISEYAMSPHLIMKTNTNAYKKKTEAGFSQKSFSMRKPNLHSPRPSNPPRNNIFLRQKSHSKNYSPTPTTPTTQNSCNSLRRVSFVRVSPHKHMVKNISPLKIHTSRQYEQNKNKTFIENYQRYY